MGSNPIGCWAFFSFLTTLSIVFLIRALHGRSAAQLNFLLMQLEVTQALKNFNSFIEILYSLGCVYWTNWWFLSDHSSLSLQQSLWNWPWNASSVEGRVYPVNVAFEQGKAERLGQVFLVVQNVLHGPVFVGYRAQVPQLWITPEIKNTMISLIGLEKGFEKLCCPIMIKQKTIRCRIHC